MAIDKNFISLSLHTSLVFLPWIYPHLFFSSHSHLYFLCSLFSDSTCTWMLTCSPSLLCFSFSVPFLYFRIAFFLSYLFTTFFCLIYFMWYLDSVNHTFHIGNSQVSRGMGQIGSLENFSTTSKTYGFSLYFKVTIFLPCGPGTCGSTRHSSP